MHVHIHPFRIADQVQHSGGVAVAREEIEIGHPQRAVKQAVLYRAAVHEDILLHRGSARIGRQSGIALQPQPVALQVHPDRILGKLAPQHPRQPYLQGSVKPPRLGIGAPQLGAVEGHRVQPLRRFVERHQLPPFTREQLRNQVAAGDYLQTQTFVVLSAAKD